MASKPTGNPPHRPLKYETVEDLDAAIKAYFDMCDPHQEDRLVESGVNEKGETIFLKRKVMTDPKPYTMSGLALALDISYQTLMNYSERPDYLESLERARQRCMDYAESQLFGPYANGAKFSLNVNYGLIETKQTQLTGKDGGPVETKAVEVMPLKPKASTKK